MRRNCCKACGRSLAESLRGLIWKGLRKFCGTPQDCGDRVHVSRPESPIPHHQSRQRAVELTREPATRDFDVPALICPDLSDCCPSLMSRRTKPDPMIAAL